MWRETSVCTWRPASSVTILAVSRIASCFLSESVVELGSLARSGWFDDHFPDRPFDAVGINTYGAVTLLVRGIGTVFAREDVRIRLEHLFFGHGATATVEEREVLRHLAAVHLEVSQLVLVDVPEFTGDLLNFRVTNQSAQRVELKLLRVLYFISESFAGFVVNDCQMLCIQVADGITLKTEPR